VAVQFPAVDFVDRVAGEQCQELVVLAPVVVVDERGVQAGQAPGDRVFGSPFIL
jgi:hypothetical protein